MKIQQAYQITLDLLFGACDFWAKAFARLLKKDLVFKHKRQMVDKTNNTMRVTL